jgi:DNA-binding beta-propeller fold protein YncE
MKIKYALVVGLACTAFGALPLAGCGDDDDGGTPEVDAAAPDTNRPPIDSSPGDTSVADAADGSVVVVVGKRPSKSGTIAISDDDALVAMVNPEDGSLSVFKTADDTRLSKVATGKEPSAVVIAPDSKTAWVANRGDATVVKITGLNTATPTVGTPIAVGSEPTGLALSPTAAKLFVAEFGENRVGVIDTATMTRTNLGTVAVRAPRAIVVTNNNDTNDADETVVVTEFFGEPIAGKEGQNDGRTGKIVLLGTDGSDKGSISLAPFTNTEASFETTTSPNQLHAVAVAAGQIYVPSISASPRFPLAFDKNLYPVVHVADLATKAEVKTAVGTTNLAQLVMALPAPRFFLGETVDIDFVPNTKIAYSVSRAADVVQRIDYSGAAVAIGATQAKQIDVQGNPSGANALACHNPTGIAIARALQKGYVNCWGSRRMAVLDFTSQNVAKVVESAALPATPDVRGRHFFFTGRGRWSGNGTATVSPTAHGISFSSCGSCHPDGSTSDNITWHFGAGPRQSTALDGSYSHGALAQKQRIFNWSGIIDEMDDFEANTRGTSGGLGVVVNAPTAGDCGNVALETRRGTDVAGALPAALAKPTVKELGDGTAGVTTGVLCQKTDWADIDAYVKQIRPAKSRRFNDAAAVARGLALFSGNTGARCEKCHSGAGWTVSRRDFTPTSAAIDARVAGAFPIAGITPPTEFTNGDIVSQNTLQIQAQQPRTAATADPAPDDVAQTPTQLSCAIRNVLSFGVRNTNGTLDTASSLELEKKSAGTRAQGFRGYNVPSLYGMSLGGPYLHHGQAKTLEDLFTDTRFMAHWTAGNPNFNPATGTQRADIIAFILSIDASTTEIAIPATFDICNP